MRVAFLFLILATSGAQATCYADYKAKRDNPLRLHYGVAQINDPCTAESATTQLAGRLSNAGWQLLTVVSTFEETGLDQRKTHAGEYFLRF